MGRSHRISRGLIGLLGVVVVLGLAFYLNNVRVSQAGEAEARADAKPTVQIQPPPQQQQAGAVGPSKTITPAPARDDVRGPATKPANASLPRPFNTQDPTRPSPAAGNAAPHPPGGWLAEAASKKSLGNVLGARKVANDALTGGRLGPADAENARRMIAEINQTVVFSPKVFDGDEFAVSHTVRSGENLRAIADRHDVPWEIVARVNGMSDPRKLRAGQNLKVLKGPFHAVVSKSKYTMDLYLGSPGERGSMYVRSFNVGLGSNDSTPTGSWLVETHKKIKNPTYFSPRGEGVVDADDPKNPLGERWIGLTGIDGQAVGKQSYGIHGTIDPDSIGKQASMGCVRLRNEDVELVYDMLVEGKSVVVIKD